LLPWAAGPAPGESLPGSESFTGTVSLRRPGSLFDHDVSPWARSLLVVHVGHVPPLQRFGRVLTFGRGFEQVHTGRTSVLSRPQHETPSLYPLQIRPESPASFRGRESVSAQARRGPLALLRKGRAAGLRLWRRVLCGRRPNGRRRSRLRCGHFTRARCTGVKWP
jgi:hypothetical protein